MLSPGPRSALRSGLSMASLRTDPRYGPSPERTPLPLVRTETTSPLTSRHRIHQSYSCDMKIFLSFLCGAALMLCFGILRGSNPSHHVYELRMYHVKPGKMDALVARFGDHTDAIFKRHNMKSVGYWVPEGAPNSQNLFVYILEHP